MFTNLNYYSNWANPNVNQLKARNIETDALTADAINLPVTNQAKSEGVINSGSSTVLNLYDANATKNNTFIGRNAGFNTAAFNNTTTNNTGIGSGSCYLLSTTAANNTALGVNSLSGINNAGATGAAVTGILNTAIGYRAMNNATDGNFNTALGADTLQNSVSSFNTALGYQSARSNTTGNYNTSIGSNALDAGTTARENVAIGGNSMIANLTGNFNVAVGNGSLAVGTNMNRSVGIGYLSLAGGSNCVAVGSETLLTNSGNGNSALGYQALRNVTTGTNNTCIGIFAGLVTTTGSNNIIIGNAGGSAAENNTIRIGTRGSHLNTYLSGIVECGNIANNTEGITLLNNIVGYTPTLLNYYEIVNNASISYSGAAAATITTNKFTRIGRKITINLTGFSAAFIIGATIQAGVGSIPARFAPPNIMYFPVYVLNNATSTIGLITLNTDGSYIIEQGVNPVFFTGPGNAGILSTCISYTL